MASCTDQRRYNKKPPARHKNHPSTVTCNTDAAWNKDRKTAGFGWVFSSRGGERRNHGSTAETTIRSAQMAEAIAVHKALQQAQQPCFTHISVASKHSREDFRIRNSMGFFTIS
ncbi:unnamed protein product [Microthlaspi erraticum]|uniref:RNase H type-1 domain-containing protein n=1 Tax=Microthlaspi erraticum TaxID=1685480 RepID=A0A6D2K7T9_9BRAS|nr:unnamed protein product [Microthlaspi erraticum]